jgi:hypothetical protein
MIFSRKPYFYLVELYLANSGIVPYRYINLISIFEGTLSGFASSDSKIIKCAVKLVSLRVKIRTRYLDLIKYGNLFHVLD